MKDFEVVTASHWTSMIWIILVLSVVVFVLTKLIWKTNINNKSQIVFVTRLVYFTGVIIFVIAVVLCQGTWMKKGEYQGEFKVVQAKINNGGEFSDRYTVTLADKNGRQQTFGSNNSEHINDIGKGDKVILKVEMPFDKKPVWTKSIDEQGGKVVAVKKADN